MFRQKCHSCSKYRLVILTQKSIFYVRTNYIVQKESKNLYGCFGTHLCPYNGGGGVAHELNNYDALCKLKREFITRKNKKWMLTG
jgi:hypothetical protein